MLEARNVTVKIGDKALVNNVSLTVNSGELVAIVGPNGAGKSTLLKAMTGDMNVSAGEIYMGGKPLQQWRRRDRARVRAVLAQQSTLTFAFTVLEVVLMGRGPHVRNTEQTLDYEIAEAALNACSVAHLADRYYTTLSGGEQQRVQTARVLAQIWTKPESGTRYLLMDEPTNNLDLSHQHSTLSVAREFAADGTAVLAILHDLNLAAQYADRVLILRDGQELVTGTPHKIMTSEIIEAAFGMPVTVVPHPNLDCPLIVPGAAVTT